MTHLLLIPLSAVIAITIYELWIVPRRLTKAKKPPKRCVRHLKPRGHYMASIVGKSKCDVCSTKTSIFSSAPIDGGPDGAA